MSDTSRQMNAFQFRLDNASGIPVYRQIIDRITGAIASGSLTPGTQLPTVRQVAVDLAINPNTVGRAYKELEIRGILTTQQGTGRLRVAETIVVLHRPAKHTVYEPAPVADRTL